MTTTIDNSQRVFQLVHPETKAQVFCNLKDITKVAATFSQTPKINYFWNNRLRQCSKNELIALLVRLYHPNDEEMIRHLEKSWGKESLAWVLSYCRGYA